MAQLQVASLESALSQAQARLAEHSSGSEVRAARAEQDRWRWQSEAEELRALLASRDREIGKMQIKQEARQGLLTCYFQSCLHCSPGHLHRPHTDPSYLVLPPSFFSASDHSGDVQLALPV